MSRSIDEHMPKAERQASASRMTRAEPAAAVEQSASLTGSLGWAEPGPRRESSRAVAQGREFGRRSGTKRRASTGELARAAQAAPAAIGKAQGLITKLPRAELADRLEWARRRARCKHEHEFVGCGGASGSKIALRRECSATVVCRKCGALVHLQAARRQARGARRDLFEPGDGCAGRRCSINFRPGQAAAAQRRMAAALSAGERFLAPWPRNLHDGNLFYMDPRSAAAAAEAALRASDGL